MYLPDCDALNICPPHPCMWLRRSHSKILCVVLCFHFITNKTVEFINPQHDLSFHPSVTAKQLRTHTLNRQPKEKSITHHKNDELTKVKCSVEVYGVEVFFISIINELHLVLSDCNLLRERLFLPQWNRAQSASLIGTFTLSPLPLILD